MKKNIKKIKSKQKIIPYTAEVLDLDSLDAINKIEVTMNGIVLPLKIGDKIAFPDGDVVLKTIAAIQIDECGRATYLLEWYDDDTFKQYWISVTELKLLKDRILQRKAISFIDKKNEQIPDEKIKK